MTDTKPSCYVLLASLFITLFSATYADSFDRNNSVSGKSLSELSELVQKNPRIVNERDSLGYTPFYWAAVNGRSDVVELMISCGADINTTNTDGGSLLSELAVRGSTDTMKVLIAHGATVNKRNTTDRCGGLAALHWAATAGQKEAAEILIANGADVNLMTDRGETPLHCAARAGHKDVASLLIAHGADVNAIQKHGVPPLHEARTSGHTEVAELLLAHGANPANTVTARPGEILERLPPNEFLLERHDLSILVVTVSAIDNDNSTNENPPKGKLLVDERLRANKNGRTINAVWRAPNEETDHEPPSSGESNTYGSYYMRPFTDEWKIRPFHGPKLGDKLIVFADCNANPAEIVSMYIFSEENRKTVLDNMAPMDRHPKIQLLLWLLIAVLAGVSISRFAKAFRGPLNVRRRAFAYGIAIWVISILLYVYFELGNRSGGIRIDLLLLYPVMLFNLFVLLTAGIWLFVYRNLNGKSKQVALWGVVLQFGFLIWLAGNKVVMIIAQQLAASGSNRAFSKLSRATETHPEILANIVQASFVGLLISLLGGALLLVALFGIKYRAAWFQTAMWTISILWLFSIPIGTILGIVVMIYLGIHRREFVKQDASLRNFYPL